MRRGLRLSLVLTLLTVGGSSARAGAARHTVEPGQTAWSIAHAYGVGVEDLLAANSIDDPTLLQSGREIRIPGPAHIPVPPRADDDALQLRWPLKGQITSRYGRRGRRLHAGLDIAAPPGTIIVAARSGRVTRAGRWWGRYGRVVLIEHVDGTSTLYAHASRSFVREGQQVYTGQAIAAVGSTGNATGPHLHFELWRNDRTVDPLPFLGFDAPEQSATTASN